MQTVETILNEVYGGAAGAAEKFGVGRSAISNWKAWGYFPSRLLKQIVADAEARGIDLPVSEVPIQQCKIMSSLESGQ